MAIAGYNADLFVTGEALGMVGESLSDSGDGVTYEVVSGSRDIWDWTSTLTVKVGGSAVSASTYEVNYLFGTVVFDSSPAGAVTVDGQYLPKYQFAQAREVSYNDTTADLDSTVFKDTHIQRTPGLQDIEGSVEALQLLDTAIGAGESTLNEILHGRDFIVFSYSPDADASFTRRAIIMFTSQSLSTPVDDLSTSTCSFSGAAPRDFAGAQVGSSYKE